MFNHLPPSSHEWQNYQSNSSGVRRLNRGSCCTPKFSLSFYKGSPWIPGLLPSSFQALNCKFTKKITHKGKMVIYTLRSQTLTFGSKSNLKNHIFIKTCWNIKFVSSRKFKSQILPWKRQILNT